MSEEKKGQVVRFTRYDDQWGAPVSIKPDDGVDFFGDNWAGSWKCIQELYIRSLHASLDHWAHQEQCTVDAPLCYAGSWARHLNDFMREVQRWVEAYQDSVRPRCEATRDGMVSVIHHVEPCTCHEECEADDDEWE